MPKKPGSIYPIHHHRIGHTLAALVLGLGGAMLGRLLAIRDERSRIDNAA